MIVSRRLTLRGLGLLFAETILPLRSRANAGASTSTIGVMTLFHPHTLALSTPIPANALLDGQPHTLRHETTLHVSENGFTTDLAPGDFHTLSLGSQDFTLSVPGKLTRAYLGALTITSDGRALVPVVRMDTEVAVASIVAAESPADAPFEALKAQAVASRSFLLALPHAHAGFDACDSTHCQFLRSPPPASSLAAQAAHATAGLVLGWRALPSAPLHIVAAQYSRSCGGHTRAQPSGPDRYPFYAVACDFCLRHPELWTRPAPGTSIRTEQQRLNYNRVHGWSAIPSGNFIQTVAGIRGRGKGAGVGLCQLGASDLARCGEDFLRILAHFFPNTSLIQATSAGS